MFLKGAGRAVEALAFRNRRVPILWFIAPPRRQLRDFRPEGALSGWGEEGGVFAADDTLAYAFERRGRGRPHTPKPQSIPADDHVEAVGHGLVAGRTVASTVGACPDAGPG